MTIRFFILQAHYRSTVDFSNEALQAAKKGLDRLLQAIKELDRIEGSKDGAVKMDFVNDLQEKCYAALNDDLNSPILISHLFDACRVINQIVDKKQTIASDALDALRTLFHTFAFDILGLASEADGNAEREAAFGKAIDLLLEIRAAAKANKDWTTSDKVRNELAALGFEVKDTKDGATWRLNK